MESTEQKLKRQFGELKAGVAQLKKDAELMNLVHTTTELKLANAVGLLNEAQQQMQNYRPDGYTDASYESVLDRMGTFLTEIEKSKSNGKR